MKARSTGRLLLLFVLACLLLLGGQGTCPRRVGLLRITFLDVGQGDAAVIESPSGKVLVVDAGGILENEGDDEGRRVVVPFLRSQGIRRIDALLLTHPHADHIGGALTLLQNIPVGLLMDNGEPVDSPLAAHILTAAQARGVPYRPARRGQVLDFGDGVRARVLDPTAQALQEGTNDASIVLRVEYGRTAFLLTGDAEAQEEDDLLRSGQPLACDVLKVAHHGSRTSSTPAFLAAAHPRLAVISVGTGNVYGHPDRQVIARLQGSGARVYRTDRRGAITCFSDSLAVRVEAMRP
ncbi:MAG TPA: ComEC/Rec2 family competence protein [Chthonomonadaceae bacterium]|nr:ComEC/Rec2 family competence protein [Chthonomonadaceae bacterium]